MKELEPSAVHEVMTFSDIGFLLVLLWIQGRFLAGVSSREKNRKEWDGILCPNEAYVAESCFKTSLLHHT